MTICLIFCRANKRIKRNIKKPLRFQTTSSDEAPRKRSKSHSKDANIEKDIVDLTNVWNEEDNSSTEYTSDSNRWITM